MNINAVVDYAVDAGVAVITVDSPPVNALSAPVRAGIYRGVETAAADAAVGAIVLICAGRTLRRRRHHRVRQAAGVAIAAGPAGPDRERPQAGGGGDPRHGARQVSSWRWWRITASPCPRPVAGCPGRHRPDPGGRRFTAPATRCRRGGGGDDHQRPPRVPAAQAHAMGLLDVLAQGPDLAEAVAFARRVVAEGRALPRVRELDAKLEPRAPRRAVRATWQPGTRGGFADSSRRSTRSAPSRRP